MSEEEQCLFMIKFHQEQYAKVVKPYLDRLAHIHICKAPTMIVTPEQYEQLVPMKISIKEINNE